MNKIGRAIRGFVSRNTPLLVTALLVVALLSVSLPQVNWRPKAHSIGTITVDSTVLAAGSVDYTLIGNAAADTSTFNAALSALPATGGTLQVVSTGTITFNASVTRAIANVTIMGSGQGTAFTAGGVTAPFTAGGNGWSFQNCTFDVAPNMGATTGWVEINVTIAGTVYTEISPNSSLVDGTASFGSVTATTLNAPTGRTASYVIAAYNAPAIVKAQADYAMPLAASDLGAVANAAYVAGYLSVVLSEGTFSVNTTILVPQNGILWGQGKGATELDQNVDVIAIQIGSTTVTYIGVNAKVGNFYLNGNMRSNTKQGILLTAPPLGGVPLEHVTLQSIEVSNLAAAAIELQYTQDSYFEDIWVVNCGVAGGTQAAITLWTASAALQNSANTFVNVKVDGGYLAGYLLGTYAVNNKFLACQFDEDLVTDYTAGIYCNGRGNIFDSFLAHTASAGKYATLFQELSDNTVINSKLVSDNATGSIGIYFTQAGGSAYGIFKNNTITGFGTGILNIGTTSQIVGNTFISNTTPVTDIGTDTIAEDNVGYIAPGEIRTISGTLAGVTPAGIMASVDNPFGQVVRVLSVDIEVTTQGAASGSMCVGIGSSATADYPTMFSVLPCDNGTSYPYFFNSTKTATYGVQTNPINWATGSGNRYLNFYAYVANASYVATYTITVMGN